MGVLDDVKGHLERGPPETRCRSATDTEASPVRRHDAPSGMAGFTAVAADQKHEKIRRHIAGVDPADKAHEHRLSVELAVDELPGGDPQRWLAPGH
jgi:hypothetical protein